MILGQLDIHVQKNELGPYLIYVYTHTHTHTHTDYLEMVQRTKTVKLSEENISINLHDLGSGNGFLDTTQRISNKRKNR